MMRQAEANIFPRNFGPLRAMGLTMAVMCFLACLALGGLLVAQRATAAWISSVGNEATILLRPLDGVDMDAEVAKAAGLAKAVEGVKAVAILDKASAGKFLEPWLGSNVVTALPLPRLISLQLDANSHVDFAQFEADLVAKVKGASLDSHQRWQAEFASLGRALVWLAMAVLVLIALATCALVAFAARSVMEANGAVIEVLQLVGAEPAFIARANDRQFLLIGLAAGSLGFAAGLGSLWLIGAAIPQGQLGSAATGAFLFGRDYISLTVVSLLLVPIAATLLAVWTARLTLLRALARR